MSEIFDEDYWSEVENRPRSCRNCGHIIKRWATLTGWTHFGAWEGVRCPGKLCGAEPAS